MKKREALLLLGVTLPFLLLLALKFCPSEADQPPPVVQEVVPAPPQVSPVKKVEPPPSENVGAQVVDQLIDAGALQHRREKVSPLRAGPLLFNDAVPPPRDVEAVVTALLPEVKHCIADQQHRIEDTLKLKVRFTAQRDGGLQGYSLVSSNWQDPYLEACLEDVFAEMHFTPNGLEPGEPRDLEWVFSRFTGE